MSADPAIAVVEQALQALDADAVLLAPAPTADELAAQVRDAPAGATIGALAVVDGLERVGALLDALREAAAGGSTVVLTVPNTPLTGRGTAWGRHAPDELRSLLGDDVLRLQVTGLAGGALVQPDQPLVATGLEADVPAGAAPLLDVLAAGPRAAELAPQTHLQAQDLQAERSELLALRADVAYLEARVAQLEARLTGGGDHAELGAGTEPQQLPA